MPIVSFIQNGSQLKVDKRVSAFQINKSATKLERFDKLSSKMINFDQFATSQKVLAAQDGQGRPSQVAVFLSTRLFNLTSCQFFIKHCLDCKNWSHGNWSKNDAPNPSTIECNHLIRRKKTKCWQTFLFFPDNYSTQVHPRILLTD